MKKQVKIVLFSLAMIAIVGFSVNLIGAQYMCGVLGTQYYETYDSHDLGKCQCNGVDQIGDKTECTYNMTGGGSDCRTTTCGKVSCCLEETPVG